MTTELWLIERIGKKIYRTKTDCLCMACKSVYDNGMYIVDHNHALFLAKYGAQKNIQYFDTIEQRIEHEKA